MRVLTLFASTLSMLPVAATAAAPSDAYQAGYKVGQVIGQAMPFIVAGVVIVVAAWLLLRVRSKHKRSSGDEPQA